MELGRCLSVCLLASTNESVNVTHVYHTHTHTGIDYEAIRDEYPTDTLTKVFTFNSARKSMSTVISLPNGGHRLLTKGASEIVLNKCSSILGENGRIKLLSNGERKELEMNVVQSMASNALRTLCIAYRYSVIGTPM